jgi:hypothetical protein
MRMVSFSTQEANRTQPARHDESELMEDQMTETTPRAEGLPC